MDRRTFITGVATVVAAPLGAGAETARRVWRIGFLTNDPDAGNPFFRYFKDQLRSHGYVEGQTAEFLYVPTFGDPERASRLVAELLVQKPDVIVAVAPPAAHAAKNATKTVPVVMIAVGRVVQTGLVPDLAHPGGNVTGLSLDVGPEVHSKQLQLLGEIVRRLSRVALLWNPDLLGINEYVDNVAQAVRMSGAQLQSLPVRTVDDLERALQAAAKNHSQGIVALPDPVMSMQRSRVASLSATYRIPAIFPFRPFVEAGALMSYGPDLFAMHARAADYVDRILKGSKPGDLPVEQPTKFELVINLKTAKALGLTIPPSLLQRADQVIE